jgi:hypothetical protein
MGNVKVNVMTYAEEALRAMQTGDGGESRTVYVIVHTRTAGPGADGRDARPFDTSESAFGDLAWELGMEALRQFA